MYCYWKERAYSCSLCNLVMLKELYCLKCNKYKKVDSIPSVKNDLNFNYGNRLYN
jgi:hypothetical protein